MYKIPKHRGDFRAIDVTPAYRFRLTNPGQSRIKKTAHLMQNTISVYFPNIASRIVDGF